jgi:hypothetical protein
MNSVNPHSTKIGNKLRQLRINKGYSQEYMAEILVFLPYIPENNLC